MFVKKLNIKKTINIENPHLFCQDKYANSKLLLNKLYLNKCMDNTIITKILDDGLVINLVKINPYSKTAAGTCDVEFSTEVFVLKPGNNILCDVLEKKKDTIYVGNKYVRLNIPIRYSVSHDFEIDMNVFLIGQKIPITIESITSSPGDDKYIGFGRLFIPSAVKLSIELLSFDFKFNKEYANLLDQMNKSLEEKKKSSGNKFEQIKNLLYIYPNDKSKEIDNKSKISLYELINGAVDINNKCIIIDPRINFYVDPYIILADEPQGDKKNSDAEKAIDILILDYLCNARFLMELIDNYKEVAEYTKVIERYKRFALIKLLDSK